MGSTLPSQSPRWVGRDRSSSRGGGLRKHLPWQLMLHRLSHFYIQKSPRQIPSEAGPPSLLSHPPWSWVAICGVITLGSSVLEYQGIDGMLVSLLAWQSRSSRAATLHGCTDSSSGPHGACMPCASCGCVVRTCPLTTAWTQEDVAAACCPVEQYSARGSDRRPLALYMMLCPCMIRGTHVCP